MTPENLAIVRPYQHTIDPPHPTSPPDADSTPLPLPTVVPLSVVLCGQVFAPNLLRPAQETKSTMLNEMPIAIHIIASFILYTDEIFTHPPITAVAQTTTTTFPSSSSSSSSNSAYPFPSTSTGMGQSLSSTLPGPLSVTGKRSYNSQTL